MPKIESMIAPTHEESACLSTKQTKLHLAHLDEKDEIAACDDVISTPAKEIAGIHVLHAGAKQLCKRATLATG